MKFQNAMNEKEKLFLVFEIFTETNEKIIIQRQIYKQFLIVALICPSNSILEYNKKPKKKYTDTIIGFFIASITINNYDLKNTIETYLRNIWN